DTELLREAIKNVKEGKKGLAGNKQFAAHLAAMPSERKIEVHQAVGPYTSLLDGKRVEPAAWSAVGLVIETDRLEVKLVLSGADLRVMLGVRGGWRAHGPTVNDRADRMFGN